MNQLLIFICMCFGVQGLKGVNNVTLGNLPAKERNRRLIPYMTFYLGQPQNAQFRQVMAVPYVPVPQYRPVPQRYIQQPTPLTRMITQNYLTLAKQLQGNARIPVRLNSNYQPEQKYYVPVQISNQQQNVPQVETVHYSKPHNILQYVRPQSEEQYTKEESDYDQREEEPQENIQYAKPSPEALVQYMKPEVQKYVTKINSPTVQYTKQEQEDYDDIVQQRVQNQYPQQYAIKSGYPKNADFQYYSTKSEESLGSYAPFAPKITITPSKLAPQPADIPEYITRPIVKPSVKHKAEEPTVTIMQSQEIDVEALPSTPATPKYHATYVAKPESYVSYTGQEPEQNEEELDPEIVDKNLNDILQGVSLSKSLPERITTENLDYSIKTLSKILRILQRAHTLPQSAKDIVKGFPKPTETFVKAPRIKLKPQQQYNEGGTPGRPHVDYPAYDEIPQTQFSCKDQRYKGFFGDPETGCQVWHYCDLNGGQASFLCPNGTIFSQVALTCDWWFNVKCASTAQLYVLNERLYKYILPQKPSFPEDYSGPLVDHYLALKFKEIEEKNKNKTEEHKEEKEYEPPFSIDQVSQNKVRSAG